MTRQYNDPAFGRGRDEFQWEQELRREDRRISCYFRELPLCLDLPGEDEMIFENMQACPGLIPAGATPGHWQLWDGSEFDQGSEEDWEREFSRPRNEWLERLDRMQVEWNTIAARVMDDSVTQIFLAVSCAFGKMQVHFADYEDTTAPDLRPLKLCLGKRVIDDINELCSMLHAVAEIWPELADKIDSFTENLLLTREFLTDRFAEIRRQQESM